MSGTGIAYGASTLRECYAMSDTEIQRCYLLLGTRYGVLTYAMLLRSYYAKRGTETGSGATRSIYYQIRKDYQRRQYCLNSSRGSEGEGERKEG
eukprot:1801129-Rhodomonas_salina.1